MFTLRFRTTIVRLSVYSLLVFSLASVNAQSSNPPAPLNPFDSPMAPPEIREVAPKQTEPAPSAATPPAPIDTKKADPTPSPSSKVPAAVDQPAAADAKKMNLPPETAGIPGTDTAPLPGSAEEAEAKKEAEEIQKLITDEKYAEAETRLLEISKRKPNNTIVWTALGSVYRLQNRFDEALEAFGKSIELAPEWGEANLRRGIVWFYKKEYIIAYNDFEEATAFVFDSRPEFWKGLCLVELKQPRKAISAFSASIKADNRYVPAHVNRGLTYYSLGEYGAALLDLSEAIRLDPKNPTIYFQRGVVYDRLGYHDRAVASYSEAIRLNPDYTEAKQNRDDSAKKVKTN